MKPSGLQLLARFSLPPNGLGLCGKEKITSQLSQCITQGHCQSVTQAIPGFKTQLPYLQTIADVTGKDPLDYQVVEAYWLGNDLLNEFRLEHYQVFLHHLQELHLPDFYIHSFTSLQPSFFIPFHLYSVRVLNQLPQTTPQMQRQMDKCMISCKKVTAAMIKNGQCNVEYNPTIKVGDTGAMHWDVVVKILTPQEINHLSFWTTRVLALANAG